MLHIDTRRGVRSRRHLLNAGVAVVALALLGGCSDKPTESEFDGNGRLTAQVTAPTSSLSPGVHALGLASPRDGRLFLPSTYVHGTPITLIVMLHGAGGTGAGIGAAFDQMAEAAGVAVLSPDSRYRTWDAVLDDFGPDVRFVDQALTATFARVSVDPARLTIAGFSDGASYALALGVTNGNLFRRIVAFSPGFLYARSTQGKPPVYLAHGTADPILPIESTSRVIRPALESAGYPVDYHEFDGGHVVKQSLAEAALAWAATP
jgi:phospholipase/carboxylesterase